MALVFGLLATVLALSAAARPLLAMLREAEASRVGSRALSNEQFVLAVCGGIVVYFGHTIGTSSSDETLHPAP